MAHLMTLEAFYLINLIEPSINTRRVS